MIRKLLARSEPWFTLVWTVIVAGGFALPRPEHAVVQLALSVPRYVWFAARDLHLGGLAARAQIDVIIALIVSIVVMAPGPRRRDPTSAALAPGSRWPWYVRWALRSRVRGDAVLIRRTV